MSRRKVQMINARLRRGEEMRLAFILAALRSESQPAQTPKPAGADESASAAPIREPLAA